MTNISTGDTITSPFTLNVQYTLIEPNNGTLSVSDTAGASIDPTPQLAATSEDGAPSSTNATLTYSFPSPPPSPMPPPPPPITGESITVELMDSGGDVVAYACVKNITVNPS
jgi:hypothetical protein